MNYLLNIQQLHSQSQPNLSDESPIPGLPQAYDHSDFFPAMNSLSDSVYFHFSRQRGCPFLNLPYKLRAYIYIYVLPSTIDHPDHGIVWHRASAAIWATSREIYKECVELMYSNYTFLADVRYHKVELVSHFPLQRDSLIPKRIFKFPHPFAARSRPLMRKFHVRIHQVDRSTDLIKDDHMHPDRSLQRHVDILCAFLKDLPEIIELRIVHSGGDEESHRVLPRVLEPFWQLKNTRAVTLRIPKQASEGFGMELQEHLTDAYGKNSLMRLPLELREFVYRHAFPHSWSMGTGDKKVVTWVSGDISILGTCKQINAEAMRVLYATNEFEFSWMLKYP